MSYFRTLLWTLTAFAVCGILAACDSRDVRATAVTAPPPVAPAAQNVKILEGTPELPASIPASTPPEVTETLLTPEIHSRFTRGTTLEQARALTAIPAEPAGGDGKAIEIFRWSDTSGTSFTARFDGGVLTTKSSLVSAHPQAGPASGEKAVSSGELDKMPVAQIAPGVYIPLDRAITSATEQPLGSVSAPEVADVNTPASPDLVAPPAAPATPTGPTVAIGGALRRAREDNEKTTSYHPHASLPAFSRSLDEGSFEIRFLNPSGSVITAGLRQDKLGRNVAVPPGGTASMKVNRGNYQLYFLQESEPDTLFEAQTITIDGFQATDVEVKLDPDNVEVHLIDYSKPGN